MVEYGRSTDLGLKVAGDLLLPEFGVESNRIELLAFVKLLLLTEAPCFSSAAIPSWSSRPFTLPMLIHCKFKQYELNWIKLLNFLFNHLIIFNRMNASVMWVMSLYGGMIFLPTFSASKYKARNATFTRRWPFRTARPGKRRFQTSARELAATLWIDMKQSNEFEDSKSRIRWIPIRQLLSKIECQDCTDHSPLMLIHGLAQQSYAKAKTKHPSNSWNSSGHPWVSWIGRDILKSVIVII